MTIALKHADRPHSSILPRPTRDPMGNKHGPLQPLTPERKPFWRMLTWNR